MSILLLTGCGEQLTMLMLRFSNEINSLREGCEGCAIVIIEPSHPFSNVISNTSGMLARVARDARHVCMQTGLRGAF